VLDTLRERFDVVILDSPPVLGLADAPLMSAVVDGVVMVVQSDRSRRGSLRASLRRLRTMQPNVLGAVLTMFDPAKVGNRYSEYYGYSYYRYTPENGSDAASRGQAGDRSAHGVALAGQSVARVLLVLLAGYALAAVVSGSGRMAAVNTGGAAGQVPRGQVPREQALRYHRPCPAGLMTA
jgi:hypothetical protein